MIHTVEIHVRLSSWAQVLQLSKLARNPMDWGGGTFPGYEAWMALSPRIPATTANAMLDAGIGTAADAGKLRLYDGVQPAAGGGTLSGNNLLAELTMNADAFPSAAAGVLTANAITQDSSADMSGTPTWFRLLNSGASTTLLDGSAGASGCDLNINVPFVAGGTVQVTSFTITMPLL